MDSPVTGGSAPLGLGELRQAILAVVVGNPHFSDHEQLLVNHNAHDCASEQALAYLLHSLRQEDATRGLLRRRAAARSLPQPGVSCTREAHLREVASLLECRALHPVQKEAALWATRPGWGVTDRLKTLGFCYQLLLENLGRIPAAKGYDALKDN